MNYPNVMKYMEWHNHKFIHHPFDGNDMVLAMNKMVEKGDFPYFVKSAFKKFKGCRYEIDEAMVYMFNKPENFFKLMEQWLGGKG